MVLDSECARRTVSQGEMGKTTPQKSVPPQCRAYTMESYSVLKKNRVMKFVMKCMELENIRLGKLRQMLHALSHIGFLDSNGLTGCV